jgi:ribonuclease G
MNKELFVSSTPHETKVGLVEDDLLAEIYLERENEYTLAGSIYKGRVTRVLPGMQSAFVDIGLERDAFLYVSDFMELEEHDEDVTDIVPANRGVPDMRQEMHPAPRTDFAASEGHDSPSTELASPLAAEVRPPFDGGDVSPLSEASMTPEDETGAPSARDSQDRDRGAYRGRRRRRGGRRDGRTDGRDRTPEPRLATPVLEDVPAAPPSFTRPQDSRIQDSRPQDSRFHDSRSHDSRSHDSRRSQQFGPPAGYQPILLPGESISKYRGIAQPAAPPGRPRPEPSLAPAPSTVAAVPSPATGFPDDEPIFAASITESQPSRDFSEPDFSEPEAAQPFDRLHTIREEALESAATTTDWNRELRHRDSVTAAAAVVAPPASLQAQEQQEEEQEQEDEAREEAEEAADLGRAMLQVSDDAATPSRESSVAFASPGTFEEETIDDEEADTVRYEQSSDEGYEEFEEEETRAAGQPARQTPSEFSEIRATVDEIHMASLAESGIAPAEGAPESEEDSEELELEEAQAQAEALLDAEAGGGGMVEARAEVRAPAPTAGYTQRAPRPRPDRPGYDRRGGGRRGGGGRRFPRREAQEVPKISDLLKEGQEILVQIAKEPIGKKGARITSHIALPGRFLVYMPTVNHTGVSRKIASDEERMRLKRIVMSERDNGHGGFIVRTAAQAASEEELRADIRFLKGLWNDIKSRAESSKPPALIYHDLNVVERVLRDQVTSDFSVIWVDTEPEYERILRFFNRFQPGLVKRVKLYTKETPLFEQFGLAEEMNKALKSKVWLKSGGYIVINQTEALVAIDINTGKYVGKTSRLEDTIVKTNVDAIKEIVRQIRLRDLGGIIIIDFIDMDERRNRQRVMQALEEELRHDRAPSKVLQFNDFGLVAITRKRVKQSLERTIGAPCPYCQSTGYVKSLTTVANEIYVEMRKMAKHLEQADVMLRVHPDVAKELKANNGRLLNEMEELTKRTIIVKSDPAVHQEQFDIN